MVGTGDLFAFERIDLGIKELDAAFCVVDRSRDRALADGDLGTRRIEN